MATADDLYSSFNKIGDEIDEIFKSMEVFSSNSVTSRESNKQLKGSSAEFSDVEFKPNLTNSEHDVEEYRKLFSVGEKKENNVTTQRSINPGYATLLTSTPSKRLYNTAPITAVTTGTMFEGGFHKGGYDRPQDLDISYNETLDAIRHEREVCQRYQAETKTLRERIVELQNNIDSTQEERNRIFFKLEAAIREISSQASVKESLCQKIKDLNQKLLDSDYEIGQLKNQITNLTKQTENSHRTHEKLLSRLKEAYQQISSSHVDNTRFSRLIETFNAEKTELSQKYDLLQQLHGHCGTINNNYISERDNLISKLQELTKTVNKSETEKKHLGQNLNKVYKLVERMEQKANEKIEMISDENTSLKKAKHALEQEITSRNVAISRNKDVVRDLEAKIDAYTREIDDIREGVQQHEKANQTAVQEKNLKIKALSGKIKQLTGQNFELSEKIKVLNEERIKVEVDLKENSINEGNALSQKVSTVEKQLSEKSILVDELTKANNNLISQIRLIEDEYANNMASKVQLMNDENYKLKENLEHLGAQLKLLEKTKLSQNAEYENKLESKTKRISKLKDTLSDLVLLKDEHEAEISKLRQSNDSITMHLKATHHQVSKKSEEVTTLIDRKNLELESYKRQVNVCESRIAELEERLKEQTGNLDLLKTNNSELQNKVEQLEENQEHLNQTVGKYKERQQSMKASYKSRLSELQAVIDQSVDQSVYNDRMLQVHNLHNERVQPILEAITTVHSCVCGDSSLGRCTFAKLEENSDVMYYLNLLENMKQKLSDTTSLNQTQVETHHADLETLKTEYNMKLKQKDDFFTEELSKMQGSLSKFMEMFDPSKLRNEISKMKEDEAARLELESRYSRAINESAILEERLRSAKRSIAECRTESQLVSSLQQQLRGHEHRLSQSIEKVRKRHSFIDSW